MHLLQFADLPTTATCNILMVTEQNLSKQLLPNACIYQAQALTRPHTCYQLEELSHTRASCDPHCKMKPEQSLEYFISVDLTPASIYFQTDLEKSSFLLLTPSITTNTSRLYFITYSKTESYFLPQSHDQHPKLRPGSVKHIAHQMQTTRDLNCQSLCFAKMEYNQTCFVIK